MMMIKKTVQAAINDQIQIEQSSSYLYLANVCVLRIRKSEGLCSLARSFRLRRKQAMR